MDSKNLAGCLVMAILLPSIFLIDRFFWYPTAHRAPLVAKVYEKCEFELIALEASRRIKLCTCVANNSVDEIGYFGILPARIISGPFEPWDKLMKAYDSNMRTCKAK